jgi:ferric-dicitrate binding protein FerR (iron transport regulator)
MNLNEAKQFIAQFVAGGYTPEGHAIFLRWLKQATIDELNAIADEHEALHEQWSSPISGPSSEWVVQLEHKLDEAKEGVESELELDDVREEGQEWRREGQEWRREASPMRRNLWIAAASVMLLSAGTYWFIREAGVRSRKDISGHPERLTNTFSNPRGGEQKQLDLPDGSKVWLNAASTLKYPVRFTGSERLVELTGEAFFEVDKSISSPFRVLIKGAEVVALGTQFDVMAYDDDPASRTTLIEGAVKVSSGSQELMLKPAQRAEVPYLSSGAKTRIRVLSGIDLRQVLDWKNGVIRFDGDSLHAVMRILSRSFNVDVQFQPNVPEPRPITAVFNRADGLNKILSQLESLNIHFSNNGKTVIVDSI